ncbi:MAG: rod shape-determining protein [Clostridia bacterium]|nr:rod shape-determining protein [Clostridia bacterium]
MSKIELAIKFGSNEIIVYRKGFGIVARECSYLATTKGKTKICAYGDEAKRICHLKPAQYDLHQPIQGHDIINNLYAQKMLNHIIEKSVHENGLITAIVAVPCALTEQKLLELKLLLKNAGINKITFVQNAVCVRHNLPDVDESSEAMIVDMGKFLVDMSVLTRYNFVKGRNYLVGGAEMDEALATYVHDNYNVTISNSLAETIKDEVASMHANDMYTATFDGVDEEGNYKQITIRANEARVAILGVYEKIFKYIEEFLHELPNDTLAEVKKNGIIFTGGVSCIQGLVEYASKRLNIPTFVVENPKDAVILGAGKLLSLNKEDYQYIKL